MNYDELIKKQKAEWKEFYSQRDQAKTVLVERHHEICKPYLEANQEIPQKLSKQIQKDLAEWTGEWSEKGLKAKEINEAHKKERKNWFKANPDEAHMEEIKRGKIFEREH